MPCKPATNETMSKNMNVYEKKAQEICRGIDPRYKGWPVKRHLHEAVAVAIKEAVEEERKEIIDALACRCIDSTEHDYGCPSHGIFIVKARIHKPADGKKDDYGEWGVKKSTEPNK